MYATIQKYAVTTDSKVDDLADLGWQLGAVLAHLGGFVASIALADGNGALITVSLFDDRASLVAAQRLADQYAATHRVAGGLRTSEVGTGEVVAQKGL